MGRVHRLAACRTDDVAFGALDDDALARRLLELGPEQRTLFAASLAERLMLRSVDIGPNEDSQAVSSAGD